MIKRCAVTVCLLLAAMTLYARGIREEADLTGENARTSYAFGMMIGLDLEQSGLEVDYFAFVQGLRDAMEGRDTKLDRSQALETVQDAFEAAMQNQTAKLQEEEMLFLAENAEREGIHVTESGLQYLVIEEGSGPKPGSDDTVQVHYEGMLTNGMIFDSSYDQEYPETIPLDYVIPGWAEGIQLMNTGSTFRFYIPSYLAYGERGAGQIIPPYSTLVFTVQLIDIVIPEDSDEDED